MASELNSGRGFSCLGGGMLALGDTVLNIFDKLAGVLQAVLEPVEKSDSIL